MADRRYPPGIRRFRRKIDLRAVVIVSFRSVNHTGRDKYSSMSVLRALVSIHAPTRNATSRECPDWRTVHGFNPRARDPEYLFALLSTSLMEKRSISSCCGTLLSDSGLPGDTPLSISVMPPPVLKPHFFFCKPYHIPFSKGPAHIWAADTYPRPLIHIHPPGRDLARPQAQ
jgi:hypothetical protein